MEKKVNNKKIILGITGSIAAYKGCDIASKLVQAGLDVTCILTAAAAEFIAPLSFQAITGNPCYGSMFGAKGEEKWDMHHLSLADRASVVVVAPASADCIARCAQGRAADLLSSVILSTRAPVLLAPAMNVNMYNHSLTQCNIKTLEKVGYHFIGPEQGRLACGVEGKGRMSEPADIITKIKQILKKK